MDYRVAVGFGRVEMKADEIRQISTATGDATDQLNDCAYWLREIAAQLADLNEHLKVVDESVFGAKK